MRTSRESKQNDKSPYPLVGRCIYFDKANPDACGGDLTDEHGVPEGLNGVFRLRKASCEKCREMTSKFERKILRDALGPTRDAMQFKSKRKKARPTSYAVQVKSEGRPSVLDMPVEAIVGMLPALDVGLPTYLAEKFFPAIPDVPTGLKGVAGKAIFRSPEKSKEFLDSHRAEILSVRLKMDVFEYARMLAKIGFCVAIESLYAYELGTFDDIEEVHVLPLIRGEVNDSWRFVGRAAPILDGTGSDDQPHRIATTVKAGEILAHVQLFALWGGPEYLVAVGRVSERVREQLRSDGDPDA